MVARYDEVVVPTFIKEGMVSWNHTVLIVTCMHLDITALTGPEKIGSRYVRSTEVEKKGGLVVVDTDCC